MATPTNKPSTTKAVTSAQIEFMNAIYANNWPLALELLKEKPNMNVNMFMNIQGNNELESSPLQHAAQHGQIELVQALIARGADVNYQNKTGQTPLMYATRGGHLDVMKAIVEAGADYNMTTGVDATYDNTALHYAAVNGHEDAALYLLGLPNINMNHVNRAGNTPHDDTRANGRTHGRLAEQMDRFGALSRHDLARREAFVEAVKAGNAQAVAGYIREGVNPNIQAEVDGQKVDVLDLVPQNKPEIREMITQARATAARPQRPTPERATQPQQPTNSPKTRAAATPAELNFMEAIHAGNWNAAEGLLGENPNMNVNIYMDTNTNNLRSSPIQFAAQNGQTSLVQALIARGADVNYQNSTGLTPLMYAARNGHTDSMRALVEGGADINRTSGNKQTADNTALHYAAYNGHKDATLYLLDQPGINMNHKNASGNTPYDDTMVGDNKYPDLARIMENRGALSASEIDESQELIRAAREGNLEEVERILATRVDPNTQNPNQETALLVAAQNGHTKVVQKLLEAGADVNYANQSENGHNNTALMLAALNGHTETVQALLGAEGINVNQEDVYGSTALHHATIHGAPETITALLGAGAKIDHQDKNGNTPLMTAASNGKTDAALALLNAGANYNMQNNEGKTARDLTGNATALRYIIDGKARDDANQQNLAAERAAREAAERAAREAERAAREAAEEASRPKTQEVGIIDFSDRAHTNAQRDVGRQRSVSIQGRRSVRISKANQQTAIRTLQGLEDSGALKTDANGQSNAEIYLQRLILVNQQEGKNSPARKALNCLFNRDGTPKTNLSTEDIQTIQAGIEYSIQHTRTTRNGRGTITSDRGDYEAKTETREIPRDNSATPGSVTPPNNPGLAGRIGADAQDITNPVNNGAAPRTNNGAER